MLFHLAFSPPRSNCVFYYSLLKVS